MSLFVDACKEHVKNKKKTVESETANKTKNTFNLQDAIKKERVAYEKDRGDEMKKKEN